MGHKLWKALVGLSMCGIFVGRLALADDLDSSMELQNLIYYPHMKVISISGSYQSSMNEVGPTINSAATETRSTNDFYNQIPFNLLYGLTDRLYFGFAQTQLIQKSTTNTTTSSGASSTTTSSGVSSPTLLAGYRVVQNTADVFYLSLDLQATLASGTHFASTVDQAGNNLSVGNSTILEASLFWHLEENEFEIRPQINLHAPGLSQGTSPANTTIYPTSYYTGSLLIAERSHFGKYFFAQPSISVSFPYAYDTYNQATGVTNQTTSAASISPSGEIGYLPVSWCLLSMSITFSATNSASQTAGTQTTNYDSNSNIGARVVF